MNESDAKDGDRKEYQVIQKESGRGATLSLLEQGHVMTSPAQLVVDSFLIQTVRDKLRN